MRFSIGAWWIAASGVPVFVSIGPELHEEFFHARKLEISVASSGVEFMAFGIFVGVVVADERQVL